MLSVNSRDGTRIAYEKTGEGPPLVLVHGTGDDHTYWEMVQPILAKHFTVFAIDRRGRGESGDSADYKLELEFDDIAAVINSIDQGVILVGHSYGGIISLEAVLRSENISKLILYEANIFDPAEEVDDFLLETIAKIETRLKEGENEQALLLLLENLLGMSSEEIDLARSTPYWQVMVNAAPTLPRELQGGAEYNFVAQRFTDLTIPILLLSGSDSPLLLKDATNRLEKSLAKSRVSILEGQGHDAIRTAPDLFTQKVLKFVQK